MHQPKLISNSEHGFRVAQEHVSVGQKVFAEMPQNAFLGGRIEVDQDVTAENKIDVFEGGYASVVEKVQSAEGDMCPHRCVDPQLLSHGLEILLAEVAVDVTQAVFAILA